MTIIVGVGFYSNMLLAIHNKPLRLCSVDDMTPAYYDRIHVGGLLVSSLSSSNAGFAHVRCLLACTLASSSPFGAINFITICNDDDSLFIGGAHLGEMCEMWDGLRHLWDGRDRMQGETKKPELRNKTERPRTPSNRPAKQSISIKIQSLVDGVGSWLSWFLNSFFLTPQKCIKFNSSSQCRYIDYFVCCECCA